MLWVRCAFGNVLRIACLTSDVDDVKQKEQFREAMAGLVPKEELTEWRNKSGGAFEIQVRGI